MGVTPSGSIISVIKVIRFLYVKLQSNLIIGLLRLDVDHWRLVHRGAERWRRVLYSKDCNGPKEARKDLCQRMQRPRDLRRRGL